MQVGRLVGGRPPNVIAIKTIQESLIKGTRKQEIFPYPSSLTIRIFVTNANHHPRSTWSNIAGCEVSSISNSIRSAMIHIKTIHRIWTGTGILSVKSHERASIQGAPPSAESNEYIMLIKH